MMKLRTSALIRPTYPSSLPQLSLLRSLTMARETLNDRPRMKLRAASALIRPTYPSSLPLLRSLTMAPEEADTGTAPTCTYSLDTNVLSYLLNGELWRRAPFNLMRVKPALAHLCTKYGMEAAAEHDGELEKSIKSFEWSCLHQNKVQLVVPPTVTLEIARAPQVSSCGMGWLCR